MRQENGLYLDNLTLSYERHPAIHHLSGVFAAGTATAVLGPNGAGKSTLLKALANLHPIDEGSIHRQGLSLAQTAYLNQAMNIEKDFPISVENFVLQGFFNEASFFSFALKREQKTRLQAALEITGLTTLAKKPIRTLSLGQLQRARWARLILQNSQLILMDEPFTGLDEQATQDLLKCFDCWKQEGRTLIVVIHDEAMAQKYFSDCLLLYKGAIKWGPTKSVLPASANEIHQFEIANASCPDNEVCIQ